MIAGARDVRPLAGLVAAGALALLGMAPVAMADAIQLTSGKLLYGDIISTNDRELVIALDYGVHRYKLSEIAHISANDGKITLPDSEKAKAQQRFPNWRKIFGNLARQPWAGDVHQVPAVVIDRGSLYNVPYTSYRCGKGGYELNIYGDPDEPAGVELGVYDDLANDPEARRNCREFIASLLEFSPDADAIFELDDEGGQTRRGNLLIEITPPEAIDSYGGWWISVMRPNAIDAARAMPDEIERISAPLKQAKKGEAGWTRDEMQEFRGSGFDSDRVFARGFRRTDEAQYLVGETRPVEKRNWFQRLFGG